MEQLDTSSDAMRSIMEKIEKLMRLANNNPNEAEAAMALAKAQSYLAEYNLDLATIERHSGESGKREEQRVMGGMNVYQRNLWRAIAELNFCFYWTMKRTAQPGSLAAKRGRRSTHEHKLIGRTVNVRLTQNMADYLERAVERLCRERLGPDSSKQFYSSEAVSYREGIADRVIEKINERRWAQLDAERKKSAEAKKRATDAGRDGAVTGTSLTLYDYSEQERDANTDFMMGEEGYSARVAKQRAERQEEYAKREAEREAAATAWAEAHPEEARKEAETRRREQERANKRWSRRRYRVPKERKPGDMNAYYSGYDDGSKVSIDPQVNSGSNIKRIK